MKRKIKEYEEVYATGVFLIRQGNKWIATRFEDDTYFDGLLVEEVENNPYTE